MDDEDINELFILREDIWDMEQEQAKMMEKDPVLNKYKMDAEQIIELELQQRRAELVEKKKQESMEGLLQQDDDFDIEIKNQETPFKSFFDHPKLNKTEA